jgi:hypothetical protein
MCAHHLSTCSHEIQCGTHSRLVTEHSRLRCYPWTCAVLVLIVHRHHLQASVAALMAHSALMAQSALVGPVGPLLASLASLASLAFPALLASLLWRHVIPAVALPFASYTSSRIKS